MAEKESPECLGGKHGYIKESVDQERSKTLLEAACKSWKAHDYTDVELIVGKQRFKAHRLVLASSSDYFHSLFKQDEKDSGKATIGTEYVDPKYFSVFLEYAYTGKVKIDADNLKSVLSAAHYLEVAYVKKCCVDFMVCNLNCQDVCRYLKYAEIYSLSELKEKATQFFVKNLKSIPKTDHYSKSDPSTLIAKFQSDNLVLSEHGQPLKSVERETLIAKFQSDNLVLYEHGQPLKSVERERLIFKSVLAYLEGEIENNPHVIEMMLQEVRLTEIPKDAIKQCLEDFKPLKKNEIIQRYVALLDVANKHLLPKSWLRGRKLAVPSVSQGKRRYAADGHIRPTPNPPPFLHNDFDMEIKSIELWLRSWEDKEIIGGMQLTYHTANKQLKYMKGKQYRHKPKIQVDLAPSEFIVKVNIGSGWLIDSLGFETNQGRVFGPFGGPGGLSYTEAACESSNGSITRLFDINCEEVSSYDAVALDNLMLRWITLE